MAKTPKSLSDDERKLSRPKDFTVTVREFELATGAGFVIPVLGDIMRMPGLPTTPAAEHIDIDDEGKIVGLLMVPVKPSVSVSQIIGRLCF
jgi:formate--tetrahydrofolate ligase